MAGSLLTVQHGIATDVDRKKTIQKAGGCDEDCQILQMYGFYIPLLLMLHVISY